MSEHALRRKSAPDPRRPSDDLAVKAYLRILGGRHNAASLSASFGVSAATMFRVIANLRQRLAREGAELVSVRSARGWRFAILGDEERVRARWRAWRAKTRAAPKGRGERVKAEDAAIARD
jgi:hypothetical protein